MENKILTETEIKRLYKLETEVVEPYRAILEALKNILNYLGYKFTILFKDTVKPMISKTSGILIHYVINETIEMDDYLINDQGQSRIVIEEKYFNTIPEIPPFKYIKKIGEVIFFTKERRFIVTDLEMIVPKHYLYDKAFIQANNYFNKEISFLELFDRYENFGDIFLNALKYQILQVLRHSNGKRYNTAKIIKIINEFDSKRKIG